MKPYLLTVSIVVYNPNLADLRAALQSVFSSQLSVHITIVDNSETSCVPAEFLKEFQNLCYLKAEQNVGYGCGHNMAIKEWTSLAPYHLVLNPDVYFNPLILSQLLDRLNSDHRIGLAIPGLRYPDDRHQPVNRRLPRLRDYVISFLCKVLKTDVFQDTTYRLYHLSDLDKSLAFTCPVISGCFMLFRTSALVEVGGFDEQFFLYFEDTDLSRRIAQKHLTVVFPDLIAYHQWNRGAYKNLRLFTLFIKSMIKYFNKWGWFSDREKNRLNSLVGPYFAP